MKCGGHEPTTQTGEPIEAEVGRLTQKRHQILINPRRDQHVYSDTQLLPCW